MMYKKLPQHIRLQNRTESEKLLLELAIKYDFRVQKYNNELHWKLIFNNTVDNTSIDSIEINFYPTTHTYWIDSAINPKRIVGNGIQNMLEIVENFYK